MLYLQVPLDSYICYEYVSYIFAALYERTRLLFFSNPMYITNRARLAIMSLCLRYVGLSGAFSWYVSLQPMSPIGSSNDITPWYNVFTYHICFSLRLHAVVLILTLSVYHVHTSRLFPFFPSHRYSVRTVLWYPRRGRRFCSRSRALRYCGGVRGGGREVGRERRER